MKKIFYWSVGSFFRTIGKFIAFIVIGGLFALLLSKSDLHITDLIGITRVSALTGSYTGATYAYRSITCSVQGNNCIYDGLSYFRNINTRIDNGDKSVGSIFFRAYNTNKFKAGNTYKLTYTICENSKWSGDDTFERLDLQSVIGKYEYNTSNSADNATQGNLSDVTLQVRDNPNSSQCWYADLSFNAYTDLQYVGFDVMLARFPTDMNMGENFGFFTGGWFNVTNLQVTYEEGIGSSIANGANQIINNAQNNTNNIINNQNNNTQQIIDNQKELLGNNCENLANPQNIFNGYINTSNNSISYETSNDRYSMIVSVQPNTTYTISKKVGHSFRIATTSSYPSNNTQYLTTQANHTSNSMTITTGSNAHYLVIFFYSTSNGDTGGYNSQNLMVVKGSSVKPYCEYGSFSSKLDNVSNSVNSLNDTLNNDDVSGAENSASSFFSNFNTNTHGLSSIITAPLSAIQSLSSSSCSPLVLPLPFVNENLTLPCMRPIYEQYFGSFIQLYDVITLGFISYWVLVRIFALVKDFKNPEHDEIEVVDL